MAQEKIKETSASVAGSRSDSHRPGPGTSASYPARPILESLYSPDPRGQKPYDPVRMLRALLLMVLLKYTSITKWIEALKANPRLARMAGFEPDDVPVAGTFYAFIDRLEACPRECGGRRISEAV